MRQTLDRYVGRAIAASFMASLVFFLSLTILIDLLNHLGHYLDKADQQGVQTLELLWFLASYYVRLLPVSFVQIAPFVTVIGCMFAVARLIGQNELQPMLFVGRSMVRVLRPALICSVLVGLGMAGCWQWLVPVVAEHVSDARSWLVGGQRQLENIALEKRGDGFTGLQVRRFDVTEGRLEGVRLLREGVTPGDAVLIRAELATWDASVGDWRLHKGTRRTVDREDPCAFLGAPEWTPEAVRERGKDTPDCELLSYGELVETRQLRPTRRDVAMALHRHITYPLANLILLLLALPFAIHFERGSRIERVLGAIGVCVAYLLFDLICQNLGLNGWIHPVVAAWSPTIMFGSLGVVMFSSIRT